MLTPTTLFKCLADETRFRCMVLLHKEGRLCVCELMHALNISQPKISRHLALLRQINILQDSREKQWIYYQVNPGLPGWVFEILDIAAKQFGEQPRLQQDIERLQTMDGRPGVATTCCD